MRRNWKLFALLALATGCAGHPSMPPMVPTDKDFEVPAILADQFATRDKGNPAEVKNAAAPALAAEPKLAKNGKKEKAPKKGKKEKMKTDALAAKKAAAEPKAAEIPNRWPMAPIFHKGERTVFDITYFGATAGELVLETLDNKFVADRPAFHFRGVARSTSVFSLFYRVNDVAESFMDTEGLFSHKFSIKLDETRQTRDVLELYDNQKRKAYYWSKWDHATKGHIEDKSEIDLVPFTQDGLSAFFYVRTLPLEIGKVWEFPLVNNGKLRTVRVTVVRKEELRTKIGEFQTFVLKPEVVLDGVLQNNGDSFLWISDDAERRILKVDAKIKVGSVIAYLREYKNAEQIGASNGP